MRNNIELYDVVKYRNKDEWGFVNKVKYDIIHKKTTYNVVFSDRTSMEVTKDNISKIDSVYDILSRYKNILDIL